jgi:hypothetical protein
MVDVTAEPDSRMRKYLRALQAMPEDAISRTVLKPLLEAMGYDRVDFHGGPNERGKDLIALKRMPPRKGYHVSVMQTKKIGNSQKSTDNPTIRRLISQLQQCFVDDFPIIDGSRVRPDAVFLACPEQLSSRLLDEINGQLVLPGHVVIPFDGPRIIESVTEYCPRLLDRLLKFEDKLPMPNADHFQNIELFSALNQRQAFDFINCYSDLSFFVGNIDSNVLLSAEIAIHGTPTALQEKEWSALKQLICQIESKLGFNPLAEEVEQVERRYQRELDLHNSKTNRETRSLLEQTERRIVQRIAEIQMLSRSAVSLLTLEKQDIDIARGRESDERNGRARVLDEAIGYAGAVRSKFASGDWQPLSPLHLDCGNIDEGYELVLGLSAKDSIGAFSNLNAVRFALQRIVNSLPGASRPGGDGCCATECEVIRVMTTRFRRSMEDGRRSSRSASAKRFAKLVQLLESIAINECRALAEQHFTDDGSRLQSAITEIAFILPQVPELSRAQKELASLCEVATDLVLASYRYNAMLGHYVPHPAYEVSYDGSRLQEWLLQSRKRYRREVARIESQDTRGAELRSFLGHTEATLFVIAKLIAGSNPLREAVAVSYPETPETDRIDLSPHRIFDTGINVAVYGGAGVGKTTTLQMYAREFDGESGLLIYLPLNRLLKRYHETMSDGVSEDSSADGWDLINHAPKRRLPNDIWAVSRLVLLSREMAPSEENLTRLDSALRAATNLKIILDGLDEAYDSIPSLMNAIRHFNLVYPAAQLIISSRDCVSYLGEIEFLGITLLPFTESKLYRFVQGWFKNEQRANAIVQGIKDKGLLDVVRTPLLATLMCSLVGQGLKLPSSETAIFGKRLALLSGEYDKFKQIRRQSLAPDVLRFVARKIAYGMHSRGERSAEREGVLRELSANRDIPYEVAVIEQAVDELINPCNILIRDSLSGSLSFGHFRFQEHLVSMEIAENRNLDLIPRLALDFWRGAFVLYAQVNSIFFLFDDHFSLGEHFAESEKTLREMFKVRPADERAALEELLDRNLEVDLYEQAILEFGAFEDDDVMEDFRTVARRRLD